MKQDVEDFIKQCLICQTKRLVRVKTKQPMLISYTPAVALDRVAVDIVGPMKPTKSLNKYILTVQDQLTKYSLAIPLKETTSCAIADAFIKNYICYFGSPRVILSDNGSNLISQFMKRIAKKFKILQVKTTSYHPEGNASIERHHHVLIEYIKKFVGDRANWDEFLHLAAFSYNTNIQDSTKFSPYELVFGRLPRTPTTARYEKGKLITTYESYLKDLTTTLNQLQKQARINIINSKEKNKVYFDKRVNAKSFRVCDYVWLLKGGKIKKTNSQYLGPYQIIYVFPNGNVKIQTGLNTTKIVHPNRLRHSFIHAKNDRKLPIEPGNP